MRLYLVSCQFCYSYLSLVRPYSVSEAAKPLGAIVHKKPGNKSCSGPSAASDIFLMAQRSQRSVNCYATGVSLSPK